MIGSNYFTNETQSMYGQISTYHLKNKILLIEDNPGDARLVEILLTESDLLDCEITHKETLLDALAALKVDDNYAAILLDLTLPDSRGFETLERLITHFPNNNVIVLTGLADKSLGLKAVRAGAQDFLIKGAFDADLLAKSLRYSIERNKVLNRLEETQRIAQIGNWEYIPDLENFTASDETYRIFGYPSRDTFFTAKDLQNPNCPFFIFNTFHEEAQITKRVQRDIKIKLQNGQYRYVSLLCKMTQIGGNTTFNGIIQDITERKLAEKQIIKSQERYRAIFNESRDAIYISSLNGKLVDFNLATETLFGFSKEDLQATQDIHLLFLPPERKNDFLLKLKLKGVVKDYEIKVRRKNGEMRYCLISANLIDNEELLGYNAVVRDITERKMAEELRKARDVAQQSAMMKEQFIASISHEMRTPMNAILGMSNLIIQTPLNKEQYGYISSIKQSSEILLGIVNDILEISTIQNGKVVFEEDNFNLYELLDNLVNVMQYKIKEKDLYCEVKIDENIPKYLKGDKLRLNQILYNLVGNAIKFTDEGHVKVSIKKLYDIGDGSLQLKFIVEDTGIGIPQDKVDAIFETFTRIRQKNRIYEGTGLGLSIAKNLVEQQGGRIGAISQLGLGSKFFFDLIFDIGEDTSGVAPKIDPLSIEIDSSRLLRLLLVEDHKMNQIVARKTLEKQWENIEVTIANNGKTAIEMLQKQSFDIILMDIQMPVMDGYETTHYIRNKMPKAIAQLPILAMTAHAHISKDEKFKQYGMDDYVLKPFEPKQLFQKIAFYIKKNP